MTMFYLVHENVCLHYDNVCLYPSRTGSVDEHWDDRARRGVRRGVLWSGAHLSHQTHARKKLSSTRQPLPAWQSRRDRHAMRMHKLPADTQPSMAWVLAAYMLPVDVGANLWMPCDRLVDAHREQAVQRRVSARLHDAGAQLARAACTA